MQDFTYNNYNALMNMLMQCADMYLGLAYAFKHNNFLGFYKFSKNESLERWHCASDIAEYICAHGKQPKITPTTEFSQDFQNIPTAIQTMLNMDERILDIIDSAMKDHIEGHIDVWTLAQMSYIYEKCRKEINEIDCVRGKLGLPGADIFSIDKWLYGKYIDRSGI